MTIPDINLLVEDGPVLAACLDWRRRWFEHREASWSFAKERGSAGWINSGYSGFLGLYPTTPVLEGWTVQRSRRKAEPDVMIPKKGTAGDAAREAVARLPQCPRQSEIMETLKLPQHLVLETPGTDFSHRVALGNLFEPVGIEWPTKDGPIFLRCADVEAHVAQARQNHPDSVITAGEWQPPAGVRIISKARKDLLWAQTKVDEEEAAAAA